MEKKEQSPVELLLDYVLGDYLPILQAATCFDEDMTEEQYNKVIDGILEIGRSCDINVYDFDVQRLLPYPNDGLPKVLTRVIISDTIMAPVGATQEELHELMLIHLQQPGWPNIKSEIVE